MGPAAQLHDRERDTMSSVHALANQAFSRAAGAPLIEGNRVRLLRDARENYPAWLDAISAAKRHIHFESVDQLIEPCPPSPVLKRRLRENAEKFIIEQQMALTGKSDVKLILGLPKSEAAEAREVSEAFHLHFAYRRDGAEKQLRRIRRFGWKSLLIGFVFLSMMMLLVQIIKRYIPTGNLTSVIQEGLTILAWVALWRPGELLLYEWYPFKRDAKLLGKLERAEVRVITETKEQADERHNNSAKSDNILSTAG